ncbi:MAG: hypothetical protein JKY59_03010 [Emcibacter sp.]|nr:hypothetical protein [Emcibacter sp.]
MKKTFSLIIGLIILSSLPQVLLARNSLVVPEPKEISFGKGRFPIAPAKTGLQVGEGLFALEIQQITETYKKLSDGTPTINAPKSLTIKLVLSEKDAKIGAEGYHLTVKSKDIQITAATPTGIFTGSRP